MPLISRLLPPEAYLAIVCHLTVIGFIVAFGLPSPEMSKEKKDGPIFFSLATMVVEEKSGGREAVVPEERRKIATSPVAEKPKPSVLLSRIKVEHRQVKTGDRPHHIEQVAQSERNQVVGENSGQKREDPEGLSQRPSFFPAPPSALVNSKAEPCYRQNPAPEYPQIARRRGWQGRVVVEATVQVDGSVAQVRLHRGSGYSLLDKAAVATVNGWFFSPELRDGRPVTAKVLVPVLFSLN